ncbi:hypothetical protein FAI41_00070 [Acetobacteraceae bacterium]|nr:hypothetical protein FAI41_00070 [Acetobacteraceae bacterium]
MKKIAFIYTPDALKNKKDMGCLVLLAEILFSKEFCIASKQGIDLNQVIQTFKQKKINHIIISSGDGTISRVMTAIDNIYTQNNFPKLTILPSGNTNLIAYDIHAMRRDVKYLLDIAHQKIKLSSVFRRTLKISFPDDERSAQLGMFGGAGFFETAVNCSRNEIENLAPHRSAILGTILKKTIEIITSKKERNKHYQGVEMPWKNIEFQHFSKDIFFTVFTPLKSLPYGMWPFWCEGESRLEGFNYLRVSSFPNRFPKAILPLMRGKIPFWIKKNKDYQSSKTSYISAELKANFILDGEFIAPSRNGKIKIELGPEIEFLV